MRFEDYAKSFIQNALDQTPPDVAPGVYVVSLFVYDEEDDLRRPTVTVGFNTEARVTETTAWHQDEARWNYPSGQDEARWNYAFWLQNELGVLGDRARDPEGVELRERWVREAALWYSDDEERRDFDAAMEKGGQITARFVELIVTLTQQLHAAGTVTRLFGRPIPVLVHELEYYPEIAEQNVRANPKGLADDFARWIM